MAARSGGPGNWKVLQDDDPGNEMDIETRDENRGRGDRGASEEPLETDSEALRRINKRTASNDDNTKMMEIIKYVEELERRIEEENREVQARLAEIRKYKEEAEEFKTQLRELQNERGEGK